MKTNEEILLQEIISYNDIKLLKNRSNKANKDVINYETFEDMQMDSESGEKGLNWLKSLLNKNEEPRKGVSLGYREIEIIKNATPNDFYFCGFYDNGCGGFHNYSPIYEIGGMQYIPYCNGEKIYIIG